MSGLHLPPAEPPADRYADLLEHVRAVREELREAQAQLGRIRAAAADPFGEAEPSQWTSWRLGVRWGLELRLAGERVDTWRTEVEDAETRARSLGLQL